MIKQSIIAVIFTLMTILTAMTATAATLDEQLASYRAQGAGSFDVKAGQTFWTTSHGADPEVGEKVCTACHTDDPRKPGKHRKTGKIIEPMAVSVTPQRFTDPEKVEKWFLRNCRQTIGRECTPQEKGDILSYLGSL